MTKPQAIQALAKFKHIQISELSPEGVRILINKKADKAWHLLISMMVIGPLVAYLAFKSPSLLPAHMRRGFALTHLQLVAVLGILSGAMGLVLALLRLRRGRRRDIVLEVRPGSLHADRPIGGRRTMNTYAANEVLALSTFMHTVSTHTPEGETQLVSFGPSKAMVNIANLVAAVFWFPEQIISDKDNLRLRMPDLTSMKFDRSWVFPCSRLNTTEIDKRGIADRPVV